ncbi:centromere protein I [Diplogelasinospora grovesii]|uniref:Centromere protein I n=1 Tax=Diplogelasinospora grovesii TaxID=303347 RepID=A0AAN6NFF4_9PEZI|nr:centromere protein I [Diplogelasinospora grovesii]
MASQDHNLGDLLEDLEKASKLPAKRRSTPVKPTVERLTAVLYDRGALPDELVRLVDLITLPNHLDQASQGAIIRNLYPSSKVDDETVLKIVGSLGHGQLKPSLALQSLSLKWLILVHHVLENPGILSQAYGVMFNLLDTAAIRPQLCHLLALITRRKHVRPFRIQTILELSRQTGADASVIGLLRVFKNYYPEIIVGEATRGRASAFKHPDPQWRARLDEIQQQHSDQNRSSGVQNRFAANHSLSGRMKGTSGALIPPVRTQHAQENSVTLEEIDSPERFVENLEKIELPTQLVAILADPLLQKLLLLRPDGEGFSRVSNWVMSCMGDVLDGDADAGLLLDMAEVIHDYASHTKILPPMLLTFFGELLKVWDGVDRREVILSTLTYVQLMDWKELYQSILQQLESDLLDNTPESQISLLIFYTSLLRNWTVKMKAAEDLSSLSTDAISGLITHVNKLTLTLTQTSPAASTYLRILDFYDGTAAIVSDRKLLPHTGITVPPALVVYILHFSHSLVVVSRLCGILAIYKRAWEAVMSPLSARTLNPHEREQVNTFNGFLMDLCNCLWRGRAFAMSDTNSQGCRIPRSIEPALRRYVAAVDNELSLGSVFGLSHSPVLCLQAISYVRELEDAQIDEDGENTLLTRHAGPVTQQSLVQLAQKGGLDLTWQAYRSGVLRYLERNGFRGVPELMYNTMKQLMRERHLSS